MRVKTDSQSLFCVVYVSASSGTLDRVTLEQILESSRKHNAVGQISGLIVYRDGRFMQILEGAVSVLEETMLRIQADPRHHGIDVVLRQELSERLFGSCLMAFPYTYELTEQGLRKYSSFNPDHPESKMQYRRVFELLESFRDMFLRLEEQAVS